MSLLALKGRFKLGHHPPAGAVAELGLVRPLMEDGRVAFRLKSPLVVRPIVANGD